MAKEKLFYVGIKGLIRDKQSKLLVMKSSLLGHRIDTEPYWDIPGGRIEEGGDVIGTLKREIEEETGITDIDNIEFFTAVVSHHEIPLDDERRAGLVLMVYTVEIPEKSTIILSPEHTEYEWVDDEEAARRLVHKYPDEFIKRLKN